MTIIEEVKETFKNCGIGTEFTTAEINQMVHSKFGRNPNSVIPSDYSYNMNNKGKIGSLEKFNIFRQIKRGLYEYVGENYKKHSAI